MTYDSEELVSFGNENSVEYMRMMVGIRNQQISLSFLQKALRTSLLVFSFATLSLLFASNAHAQNCTPQVGTAVYNTCISSATAFYSNITQCQQVTCWSGYQGSGSAATAPVPIPVQKQVNGEAAVYGKQCGSTSTGAGSQPKGQNVEFYGGRMFEIVGSKMLCSSVGCTCVSNGASSLIMLGPPPEGSQIAYSESGALGTATKYIAQMSGNKIVSSTEYVADLQKNLHLPGVDTAYAQGLGFSSLSPVLGLWKLFRNLAYFFYVVIFLIVGMLIMFRAKIGSQAAVTVQQALPKMIISLILVTFSYAIAGLMVDIMYLVIYLVIALFSASIPTAELATIAFRNNFVQNTFKLLSDGTVGSIAGSLGEILVGALNVSPDTPIVGAIVQGGSNLIFTLVLAGAVLISMFKVFFALIRAYISVFFAVIFAPIILLIGAFPGQSTFSSWLRGLVENLMVFPILIMLIFITSYFTKGILSNYQPTNSLGFSPPQLGSNQTQGGFEVYKALIPFAAIVAMPEVLKITQGVLRGKMDFGMKDVKQNLKLGGQLGIPLAAGAVAAPTSMVSGAFNAARYGQGGLLTRMAAGATIGYRNQDGDRVGGLLKGTGKGLAVGQQVSATYDRALEGQLLDPTTNTRQLSELLQATRAANKSKKE